MGSRDSRTEDSAARADREPSGDSDDGVSTTAERPRHHSTDALLKDLLAADAADEVALAPGSRVGRYVVIDKLGAGGMGVVYKASDPRLERSIALKVMPVLSGAIEDQTAASDRLLGEAQALAKLSHPNVVAVHDVGMVGDDVFVAMELVKGPTLTEWCRQRPELARILEVFGAAGRGIAAAHAAGLIHRDFKPDNVIVGNDGRVRVLDFGLARSIDATPAAAMKGITGTPAYMAPEQHLGEKIDAKTDQYSFVAALYEAVYGALPFAGKSAAELEAAVLAGRLADPPGDADIPPWLRQILLRGLARTPADRFPSMDELLAALARGPGRRWRLLGLLGLLALTLAFAGLFWLNNRPRSGASPCQNPDQHLAKIWDDEVKERARAKFLASGRPHAKATFERIEMILDGQAAAWVEMWSELCAAQHRGGADDDATALRLGCLDERLAELRKVSARFTGEVDAPVVDNAMHGVFQLSSIDDCHDVAALRRRVAAPAPPPPIVAGCGIPTNGRYSPLAVGRVWVYDVIDPSTGLPQHDDPKVLTVEAEEEIGGCKPATLAFRTRRKMATGYADRWQEVKVIASPDGRRAGQITLRHRDRWQTNEGKITKDEYYQPGRVRLDETCTHTLPGATFVDTYDEVDVTPAGDCGRELGRETRTFDWQVVGVNVKLKLALDYSQPACCPDGGDCRPPPDGPGHRCSVKPGGAATDWICEFDTIEVQRREVDGRKLATYWFAADVGKVKEYSRGEEIEDLICFTVP